MHEVSEVVGANHDHGTKACDHLLLLLRVITPLGVQQCSGRVL